MDRIKVFASEISNLSDARYFAAMDVTYLGISLESGLSIESLKQILDWVEGPEFVFEHAQESWSDDFTLICHELSIQKVVGPLQLTSALPDTLTLIPIIYNYSDIINQECILTIDYLQFDFPPNNKIWLNQIINPNQLELLQSNPPYGVVIKGGEEERPGFKSFDDLELFFETLESI